jgi:hypothetical protein
MYHIGVVKSYLGYYEEALHFFQSADLIIEIQAFPQIFPIFDTI